MSLIYGRQLENRTDYLKDSLGRDFGKRALDSFIGFNSFVFWHAAAVA
jgi:hypothetical protein